MLDAHTVYPPPGYTSASKLYSSMGTFWTQMFVEQGTLKGYTIAQAEELIQHYYNLVEAVNSFSSSNISIFHREKWYPVRIRKSQLSGLPFKFEDTENTNVAYFGEQPTTDNKYAGQIFKFGNSKYPIDEIYSVPKPENLKQVSCLTNQIINPSSVMFPNIDFLITENTIQFNQNLFNSTQYTKYDLFDISGSPVYFTNSSGDEEIDQEIILWFGAADLDTAQLYKNFGVLFDLSLDSSEFYKKVMDGLIKLYSCGPTVKRLKSIAAAMAGIDIVIDAEELIEDIYELDGLHYICTDKHVYKFSNYYSLLANVKLGATVYAGDILVNAVGYFDNVETKNWWQNHLSPEKLKINGENVVYPHMSMPSWFFLGNYEGALTFKHDYEIVSINENGDIVFPIYGSYRDVQTFHNYINENTIALDSDGHTRRYFNVEALGLTKVSSIVINPLDFIFSNFLKHNTAMLKFNFASFADARNFLSNLHVIRDVLPRHIYFMFFAEFEIPMDHYDSLTGKTKIGLRSASPIVFDTSDVDIVNDTITISSHGLETDDYVVVTLVNKNLPKGLLNFEVYQVEKVSANIFKLVYADQNGRVVSLQSIGAGRITKVTTYSNNADSSNSDGKIIEEPNTTGLQSGLPTRQFYIGNGLDLYSVPDNIECNSSNNDVGLVNDAVTAEYKQSKLLILGF